MGAGGLVGVVVKEVVQMVVGMATMKFSLQGNIYTLYTFFFYKHAFFSAQAGRAYQKGLFQPQACLSACLMICNRY